MFAGLAALEQGRHADAKQHYKTAITSQPDEPLAWKVAHLVFTHYMQLLNMYVLYAMFISQGLANYYDKHPPRDQDEVEDAIQTYQTLLIHVE